MAKKMARKIFLTVLVVILVGGHGWWATRYYRLIRENAAALSDPRDNQRAEAISFLKFFIARVLQNDGEISFDDRLRLENTIRDVNDEQALSQWRAFIESKNNDDAQKALKNLLEALVSLL